MAYAYEVFGPTPGKDGVQLFRIVETGEITTSSQWEIDAGKYFGAHCHIQEVNCDLLTADGVSTLQPAFGYVSGWTIDEKGHISQAETAAANVRIGQYKNVRLVHGKLYGKSTPDTTGGSSTVVETLITLAPGSAI